MLIIEYTQNKCNYIINLIFKGPMSESFIYFTVQYKDHYKHGFLKNLA